MVAAWGQHSKELDDDVDEIALMAIRDSDSKEEEATSEVSILKLQENLHIFF